MTPLKLTAAAIALAATAATPAACNTTTGTSTGPADVPAVTPAPGAPKLLGDGTDFEYVTEGIKGHCNDNGTVAWVTPASAMPRAKSECAGIANWERQFQNGLNNIPAGDR